MKSLLPNFPHNPLVFYLDLCENKEADRTNSNNRVSARNINSTMVAKTCGNADLGNPEIAAD